MLCATLIFCSRSCLAYAHIRRYFYFHSSLLLWNQSFGQHYPALRYMWRLEPDVLFAGSWATLLERTDPMTISHHPGRTTTRDADVLLPRVTLQDHDPGYPHWAFNHEYLKTVPSSKRAYSLVSIGRYSLRFLGHMALRWAAGLLVYEEILLPTTCLVLGTSKCKLGMFSTLKRAAAGEEGRVADYFRYKPAWDCGQFLRSAARGTQDIWHPVKHRSCWLDFLDTCNASGCYGMVLS